MTTTTIQDRLNEKADAKCKREIEDATQRVRQLFTQRNVNPEIVDGLRMYALAEKINEAFIEHARNHYRDQETKDFIDQFESFQAQLNDLSESA